MVENSTERLSALPPTFRVGYVYMYESYSMIHDVSRVPWRHPIGWGGRYQANNVAERLCAREKPILESSALCQNGQ